MRTIDTIIIHSTATPRGMSVHVKDIDKWHKQRGFKEIGYHYLITAAGNIETGRPCSRIGAHAKGHNLTTIGIAYVGGLGPDGLPKDTRTKSQKDALISLINFLKEKYPSITRVLGHRDVSRTACPSFDAKKEYQHLI